jgi:HK97 gp10 family phage protein
MSSVKVRWDGARVKQLADLATKGAIYQIGLVIEGQAKELTPVDQGRLKASITTVSADGKRTLPTGPGANPGDLISAPSQSNQVYVGTPVEYGPYQEYGTRRNEAQPFLRPALELAKGEALTIVFENGRAQFAEYIR